MQMQPKIITLQRPKRKRLLFISETARVRYSYKEDCPRDDLRDGDQKK